MARATRMSDRLYNIQRRDRRQAERYERRAASAATDKERAALEASAEAARAAAAATYVNPEGESRRNATEARDFISKTVYQQEERSLSTLAGAATTDRERRDQQARAILSGGRADAFYAATRDLWADAGGDGERKRREDVNEAIVQGFRDRGFDVSDIIDVMQALSDLTGVDYLTPQGRNESKANYVLESRLGMNAVARLQNAQA